MCGSLSALLLLLWLDPLLSSEAVLTKSSIDCWGGSCTFSSLFRRLLSVFLFPSSGSCLLKWESSDSSGMLISITVALTVLSFFAYNAPSQNKSLLVAASSASTTNKGDMATSLSVYNHLNYYFIIFLISFANINIDYFVSFHQWKLLEFRQVLLLAHSHSRLSSLPLLCKVLQSY